MTAAHPALVVAWAPWRPRPWARPRWDSRHRRTYTSPAQERAGAELALLLGPSTPRAPLAGPLRLTLVFALPPRQRGGPTDGAPHASRPDLDNLAKLVMDVLSRLGWWTDDAQVSTLVARKRWCRATGVHVRVDPDEEA